MISLTKEATYNVVKKRKEMKNSNFESWTFQFFEMMDEMELKWNAKNSSSFQLKFCNNKKYVPWNVQRQRGHIHNNNSAHDKHLNDYQELAVECSLLSISIEILK